MWLQTIIGISVVFIALIVLSFFIYLFGKVMTMDKTKSKKQSEVIPTEKAVTIEVDGDDELIAVITAAVSAYLSTSGLTPECKIKVKAFNRVTSNAPAWNEVNKRELVENN